MSLRLVIDEKKRLAAEVELVYDTGDTVLRRIDANSVLTIHFEDLEKEAKEKKT